MSGNRIKHGFVLPVQNPYFRFHANISVRVSQKTLYRYQNFRDGQTGNPVMLLNRIDPDITVSGDVGVENSRQKPHFRWIEGVTEGNFEI